MLKWSSKKIPFIKNLPAGRTTVELNESTHEFASSTVISYLEASNSPKFALAPKEFPSI